MIKLIKETIGTDVAYRNQYEIEVEFMHGDADGKAFECIRFTDEQLNDLDFMVELEEFLVMLNECIRQDRKGRGGFDEMDDCISQYASIKDWARFNMNIYEYGYEDEELEDMVGVYFDEPIPEYNEESYFHLEIPCDHYGWYASYREVNIYYYDNSGNEYNVTVEYS
tara:strand:- start:8492 stop:8992 length:501 start_codon:yes stop_codon:yes gene_type:complete